MTARSGWGGSRTGGAGGWVSETGADPAVGLVALANRVDRAHRVAIKAMGLALEREIKVELSKPGTGRVYNRGTGAGLWRDRGGLLRNRGGQFARLKKGVHVASAPGHPPAVDTGILRASIGTEVEDARGSVRVGTNVKYAPILELEMDRPFMATAVARVRRVFSGIIISALRSAAQPRA